MRFALPLLLLLAVVGCEDDAAKPAGAPASPAPGAGEGEGEVEPAVAEPAWPAPPPTLRRLSHGEYNASVRDLFAPQALPDQVFADDPKVHGFDNQAKSLGPSPLLIEQRRAAASQIADVVQSQGPLDEWAAALLRRAFRGPVSDDDAAAFGDLVAEARELADDAAAAHALVTAVLQAPRFVYRIDDSGPHAVASRLSYLLWGTPPDGALMEAAESGGLTDPAVAAAHIDRMLGDARAAARIVEFHRQWLDLDSIRGINKDAWAFPDYDESLKRSMREEADRFIEAAVASGGGHPELLRNSEGSVDALLARLYDDDPPAEGLGWAPTAHHPAERAGLLTQGWFLASRAHVIHPSPVLRGVFVLKRLLCRTPPPPDPGADTAPPTDELPDALKTNRQRYAAHVAEPSCQGCHDEIDGIGFSFESYDAVGAYRLTDAGEPVDSSGWVTVDGTRVEVRSAVELTRRLADSAEVDRCVARQWFRFGFGRDLEQADDAWFEQAVTRWQASGRGSRAMLRELAVGLTMAK